jgi:hypothetical protein
MAASASLPLGPGLVDRAARPGDVDRGLEPGQAHLPARRGQGAGGAGQRRVERRAGPVASRRGLAGEGRRHRARPYAQPDLDRRRGPQDRRGATLAQRVEREVAIERRHVGVTLARVRHRGVEVLDHEPTLGERAAGAPDRRREVGEALRQRALVVEERGRRGQDAIEQQLRPRRRGPAAVVGERLERGVELDDPIGQRAQVRLAQPALEHAGVRLEQGQRPRPMRGAGQLQGLLPLPTKAGASVASPRAPRGATRRCHADRLAHRASCHQRGSAYSSGKMSPGHRSRRPRPPGCSQRRLRVIVEPTSCSACKVTAASSASWR